MVVPESGIQVTSHLRFLIPSHSFLLSNFRDDDMGERIALHTWGSLDFSTQPAVAFRAVVISSEVEKSSLQTAQRCVLESGKGSTKASFS